MKLSKRYAESVKLVDKTKEYDAKEALDITYPLDLEEYAKSLVRKRKA